MSENTVIRHTRPMIYNSQRVIRIFNSLGYKARPYNAKIEELEDYIGRQLTDAYANNIVIDIQGLSEGEFCKFIILNRLDNNGITKPYLVYTNMNPTNFSYNFYLLNSDGKEDFWDIGLNDYWEVLAVNS